MLSLKYRSSSGKPLAPLGFSSRKLDGVRLYLCRRIAFREDMIALSYNSIKYFFNSRTVR